MRGLLLLVVVVVVVDVDVVACQGERARKISVYLAMCINIT